MGTSFLTTGFGFTDAFADAVAEAEAEAEALALGAALGVAAADEDLLRFQRALDRLSLAKRVTVVLSDVEGFSGPEIAEALEVPVGTVWTRLHHARAALRLALAKEPRS